MNNQFLLVVEVSENKYEPVVWKKTIISTIEEIDDFTSKFVKDDFRNYLISHDYIDRKFKYNSIQILYSDNGIKKIKSGVLYLNDYSNNMLEDVINLFKNISSFDNSKLVIGKFIKEICSDSMLSSKTYNLLQLIEKNNGFINFDNSNILEQLKDINYMDRRIMYLTSLKLKNTLLEKDKNKSI